MKARPYRISYEANELDKIFRENRAHTDVR